MRRRGAPLVAGALLLGLTSCGGGGSGDGEQGLDVADVQAAFDRDEPGAVTGRETTLTGRVERVLSPSGFVIAEDTEPLLVVGQGLRMPDQGDEVRVTGTVRAFDYAKLRKRLGPDVSKPLYGKHQGDPYLWAERIAADGGG